MEQSNASVRQSQIAYNIQELENTTKLLVDAVNQHKARLSVVLRPPQCQI